VVLSHAPTPISDEGMSNIKEYAYGLKKVWTWANVFSLYKIPTPTNKISKFLVLRMIQVMIYVLLRI